MTDEHYVHIKARIRDEISGRFSSSIWFALGLAVLTAGISLLVAVEATPTMAAATKGKFEVAIWACGVLLLFCMLVHCLTQKDGEKRADLLIQEMDMHVLRPTDPQS
jgi:uncharacterized BrkB/YihY/UPF0761 family membrane protein